MPRRRKLLIVAILALPVLAYVGWAGVARFGGESVQTDTQVGRTERQLHERYGSPAEDWPGYQSLALYVPPSLPQGPIRTLVFHPRGLLHPESGTLWVWVVERDGVWVCFESCWFADGVVF
jgi:hypothetical protein